VDVLVGAQNDFTSQVQAAKRIVAQRRWQKLKLTRLLCPQLPCSRRGSPSPSRTTTPPPTFFLAAACTSVPLAAGAYHYWFATLDSHCHCHPHDERACRQTCGRFTKPCSPAWTRSKPSATRSTPQYVLPCRPARSASSRGRFSRRSSIMRYAV
jgi:hypothetical protein